MTLARAVGNAARWSMPLLCVVLAILWYGSDERVFVLNGPFQSQFSITGGVATFLIDSDVHFPEYRPPNGFHTFYSTYQWWFMGDWGRTVKWISIPLWVPFAVCSAVGLAAWRFELRLRQRRRRGLCARCGYPLKDLDLGSVCPECGTAAPKASATRSVHSASDG